MADEFVSQREFARRVGVSAPAVANAIDSKRIKKEANGKINYTTEVVKWYKNRNASQIRAHNAPDGYNPEEDEDAGGGASSPSLNKAKLVKETYAAQLKKLEYEMASGKLLEKQSVENSFFNFCRMVRDEIMNIPDRVAAELTAAVISYMRPIIKRHAGIEAYEKIFSDIDEQAFSQITHRIWDKESRKAMENLRKGPKIKHE